MQVAFDLDMALLDGEYELGADVVATDFGHYYDRMERAMAFAVMGDDSAKGLADLKAQVRLSETSTSAAAHHAEGPVKAY